MLTPAWATHFDPFWTDHGQKALQAGLHAVRIQSLVPDSSFPFSPHYYPEKGTSYCQPASSQTAASTSKGSAPVALNAATKEQSGRSSISRSASCSASYSTWYPKGSLEQRPSSGGPHPVRIRPNDYTALLLSTLASS